jgi:DNA (cytosine-5)-methyltransferase 1
LLLGGIAQEFAANAANVELMPTPSRDSKGASVRAPIRTCGRVRTDADQQLPNAVLELAEPDPLAGRYQVQPIDLGMREDIWGRYAAAIARWERLTRPAPAPTEPSKRGKFGARLSPRFSEWLMGWPEGWVTDVDMPRGTQLKLIGNGVVPRQAEAALQILLQDWEITEPDEGLFPL